MGRWVGMNVQCMCVGGWVCMCATCSVMRRKDIWIDLLVS